MCSFVSLNFTLACLFSSPFFTFAMNLCMYRKFSNGKILHLIFFAAQATLLHVRIQIHRFEEKRVGKIKFLAMKISHFTFLSFAIHHFSSLPYLSSLSDRFSPLTMYIYTNNCTINIILRYVRPSVQASSRLQSQESIA